MSKVSVIIPVYNRPVYVVEAIESVLNQTHKDWELIVVDDGSTDETGGIIVGYRPQVTYIYQSNAGVAAARNRGYHASSGDYILFLDSDDLLLPHTLEMLSSYLDVHPHIGIVYTDAILLDDYHNELGSMSALTPRPQYKTALESLVLVNYITPSRLIRRTCLDELNGPWDENLYGTEDWDLWIRLAATGFEFAYVDKVTYRCRFHVGNKSSPYSSEHHKWLAALQRNRFKVLESGFFPELSEDVRWHFLYDMLLNTLRGDTDRQDQTLQLGRFSTLSKEKQAALLRHLAISNILDNQHPIGRKRLRQAVELAPGDWKSRVALVVSSLGRLPLAGLVALQRLLIMSRRRKISETSLSFPYQQ